MLFTPWRTSLLIASINGCYVVGMILGVWFSYHCLPLLLWSCSEPKVGKCPHFGVLLGCFQFPVALASTSLPELGRERNFVPVIFVETLSLVLWSLFVGFFLS